MPQSRVVHAVATAAVRGNGQDRARVFDAGEQVVAVVADGAGGTSNGAVAAQAIVDAAGGAHAAADWSALLCDLDRDPGRLGNGQTTAVIVSIRGGIISGASVGDSGAWLVHATEAIDLTAGQSRKPLVGAGGRPWRLPPTPLDDATLLVASDGLFRYAPRAAILRVATGDDLATAAQALVGLVRLPSGALQDDVAVVLCRELRVRAAADDVRSERDRTSGGVRQRSSSCVMVVSVEVVGGTSR